MADRPHIRGQLALGKTTRPLSAQFTSIRGKPAHSVRTSPLHFSAQQPSDAARNFAKQGAAQPKPRSTMSACTTCRAILKKTMSEVTNGIPVLLKIHQVQPAAKTFVELPMQLHQPSAFAVVRQCPRLTTITLRQMWPRDSSLAAMCVRNVDDRVLQLTRRRAFCCVLHRPTSRVIHRSGWYKLLCETAHSHRACDTRRIVRRQVSSVCFALTSTRAYAQQLKTYRASKSYQKCGKQERNSGSATASADLPSYPVYRQFRVSQWCLQKLITCRQH